MKQKSIVQYNNILPSGQVAPKIRSKKIAEEDVLRSDGSVARHIVVSPTEARDADFVKIYTSFSDSEGGLAVTNVCDLSPSATKILMWALMTMGHANVVIAPQEKIQTETQMSKNTVRKGLNELEKGFFIRRIPKTSGVYLVNPHVASRIKNKYAPLLEKAWKTGDVGGLDVDIRMVNAKEKEVTRENARKCAEAGLIKNKTVPDLDYAMTLEEEREILQQKKAEEADEKIYLECM